MCDHRTAAEQAFYRACALAMYSHPKRVNGDAIGENPADDGKLDTTLIRDLMRIATEELCKLAKTNRND